jgi:acyl carrier protein
VAPNEHEVLQAIREIAAQELDMSREILPSHELLGDLELDSITLVTLLASIENRFRVRLPSSNSESVRTVGDVIQVVIQRLKEEQP